jgi:hypothetical protein
MKSLTRKNVLSLVSSVVLLVLLLVPLAAHAQTPTPFPQLSSEFDSPAAYFGFNIQMLTSLPFIIAYVVAAFGLGLLFMFIIRLKRSGK